MYKVGLRLAWVAAAVAFHCATTWGQSDPSTTLWVEGMPSDVAETMQRQQEAWNRADLEGFMNGYLESDELMFIGKSGVTYGHEATLQRYITGYPDAAAMGTLTFKNLHWIQLGRDAGWLMGQWALSKPQSEDASGMYTLLWRKVSGIWVIVADHSS